ncbi:MAG TPA: BREX-2 system phosphatase PglZ, partial [Trebonia sp.]
MELVANRSVIEAEVRKALRSSRSNRRNSVLLLHAAPQWRGDETRFPVDVDGRLVPVVVAPARTVLELLDALSADRAEGEHLVVLTLCDTGEVGDSVLARALQPEIKPIDRWDLVRDAFGARQLDPLLTRARNSWIAEALLDAQPAGGWRRLGGPVLAEAAALNRLAATRLGIEEADDAAVDAAALLQWTTDSGAVAGFLTLAEAERTGLTRWLAQTAGPVADIVFRMAATGRTADAVPFGLVAAALYGPGPASGPASLPVAGPGNSGDADEVALTARIRAEERYLGGQPDDPGELRAVREALRVFGEAAESLVTRWADNGHAPQAAALRERAERVLAELTGSGPGPSSLAGRSRVLDAGLDARLAAFAAALSRGTPAETAAALIPVQDHARGRDGPQPGNTATARDRAAEVRAAEAAARLVRWLAATEAPPVTLSGAASGMLRSWSWADRALAAIVRADTSRVPGLGGAYASLCDQVRARRAQLDEAFARLLAAWTETSAFTEDLLLVENILDRVARPLADRRSPVIVVLDGMTAAIGAQLAGDLADGGGWLEAGRHPDGREPALATVPSVTSVSRTSLLTGTLRAGGQAEERSGFAKFWGRVPAVLFHKADLVPGTGRALADRVRDALLDTGTVVGVVLNTIDDTL